MLRRQAAADLAIKQSVEIRDQGAALIGAFFERELTTRGSEEDTPCIGLLWRRDAHVADITQGEQMMFQPSVELFKPGLSLGKPGGEKGLWLRPETGVPLAAETATLAADLRIDGVGFRVHDGRL